MEYQLILTNKLVIESAHQESAVECWYFQGFFKKKTIAFMASFFRYDVGGKKEEPESASILFSILNPETGENRTINPAIRLLETGSYHEWEPTRLNRSF